LQIKQQQNAILGNMKTGKKCYLQHLMLLTILTGLAVAGLLSSAPAYSDPATSIMTDALSNTSVNDTKAANTNQVTSLVQGKPVKKHILNDEAKTLSGFFIFGIVINIVMAITFIWWFSREWRRSKK